MASRYQRGGGQIKTEVSPERQKFWNNLLKGRISTILAVGESLDGDELKLERDSR
jgi:hypothetical protein